MPPDNILEPDETTESPCSPDRACVPVERRHARRYPLRLHLRYLVRVPGGTTYLGTGTTEDISSSGLRFTTGVAEVPYGPIHISVTWPAAAMDQTTELVLKGEIVRRDAAGIAVFIRRHQLVSYRIITTLAG